MRNKLTQPFSNIVSRADGSVGRNAYLLPDEKEQQELSAIQWFVKLFNETDSAPSTKHATSNA